MRVIYLTSTYSAKQIHRIITGRCIGSISGACMREQYNTTFINYSSIYISVIIAIFIDVIQAKLRMCPAESKGRDTL